MKFIPIDRMKALRDNAKNGDSKAFAILRAQADGKDFDALYENYFANQTEQKPVERPAQTNLGATSTPKPEVQNNPIPAVQEDIYKDISDPKLKKFLEYNDVKPGDMEYQSTIEAYYKEFPKARPQGAKETSEEDEFGIPDTSDIHLPDDIDDDSGSIYGTEDEDDGDSIYGDEDEPINDDEPYVESNSQPNSPVQEDKCCLDALIADELEAIEGYNKAILEITNLDESEAVKKGLIADLEEIRKDEFEHLEKLKRMKESLEKKAEAKEIEKSAI